MIYAARMDTEGRIRGSILKGDSEREERVKDPVCLTARNSNFFISHNRGKVWTAYEHLQVCDVLLLARKAKSAAFIIVIDLIFVNFGIFSTRAKLQVLPSRGIPPASSSKSHILFL